MWWYVAELAPASTKPAAASSSCDFYAGSIYAATSFPVPIRGPARQSATRLIPTTEILVGITVYLASLTTHIHLSEVYNRHNWGEKAEKEWSIKDEDKY